MAAKKGREAQLLVLEDYLAGKVRPDSRGYDVSPATSLAPAGPGLARTGQRAHQRRAVRRCISLPRPRTISWLRRSRTASAPALALPRVPAPARRRTDR